MVDYYVSPVGNDGNTGAAGFPFATVYKATLVATNPGDTVTVLPGTYNEPQVVYVFFGGTSSQKIVYRSLLYLQAKIIVPVGNLYIVQIVASNIDFIGFDLTTNDANGTFEGIHMVGSNIHTTLNYVHDIPALTQTGGGGGITSVGVDQTGNIIDRNRINRVGTLSQDTNALVQGIYIQDIGCICTANIIANGSARTIAAGHGVSNAFIANNLGLNNQGGIIVETGTPPSPQRTNFNTVVANNILYHATQSFYFALEERNLVSGCLYQNNLIYVPNASLANIHIIMLSGVVSGTILQQDPQFVNYQSDGSGDYHLKATSPCINAGVPIGVPFLDFDGKKRPSGSGYDIGPYELSQIAYHG